MLYNGSCHCGAVKFEVEGAAQIECEDCNCSICSKAGFLHMIVPKSAFTLLQGAASLTTYLWGTGIAQHTFCKTCGIKPFYTPRSNPDGVDVNVRCLDPVPTNLIIVHFDGQNWEANAHKVAHKSRAG